MTMLGSTRRIAIFGSYNFRKRIFLIKDLNIMITPCFMGCRKDVVLTGMVKNTNLVGYLHQTSWVTRCIVNEQ